MPWLPWPRGAPVHGGGRQCRAGSQEGFSSLSVLARFVCGPSPPNRASAGTLAAALEVAGLDISAGCVLAECGSAATTLAACVLEAVTLAAVTLAVCASRTD